MDKHESKDKEAKPDDFLNLWLKPMMEMWNVGEGEASPFSMPDFSMPDFSQLGASPKAQKMFHSSQKIFQLLLTAFSKPENAKALLQGYEIMPEFAMNMSQQLWGGYFELHKQWMERASRMGKHTEAYSYKDLDQDMFRVWREIYEKEFRKILQIPPLGLNRYTHERFNVFLDDLNIAQTAISEFLYVFYMPIEKSLLVMQEKTETMIEDGKLVGDFKDYYQIWIKTLEGHYMTLLKSDEYKEVFKNTIKAVTRYKKAREEVLVDLLQSIPVPTNKEMDEFYKDYHQTKKKLKELQKKVTQLEEMLSSKTQHQE